MLLEIAAEALHFLSRRDLDKACAVSKWLDAMIAQCCDVYPLRPVFNVMLHPCGNDSTPAVLIETDVLGSIHSFGSMDEAMDFVCSVLRLSFIERLELGEYRHGAINLSADHWTALIDAMRRGSVKRLYFSDVDFSALDDDAFLVAVDFRGLQSMDIQRSVIPSGFLTDDLIRSSAANGLLRLCFRENKSDAPSRLSDEVALEFFFRADAASGGQSLSRMLDGAWLTDMILAKFFERLRPFPIRPGTAYFSDAPKQHGLSAYAQYLASARDWFADAVFRFLCIADGGKSYNKALFDETSKYIYKRVYVLPFVKKRRCHVSKY